MRKSLAIILNHNVPELTDSLYESLLAQLPGEADLLVMDNGSSPEGTSRHTAIRNGSNLRFGGALNRAFSLVLENDDYDSLLFLNNDLRIETPDLLSLLREQIRSGFMIVSPSVHGECAWPQMWNHKSDTTRVVPWVDFIAPLFHRAFIEHVRGFDAELTWGWGQDVLSGIICEEKGWKVGVCDRAVVEHLGKQTTRRKRLLVNGKPCSTKTYRKQAFQQMERFFQKVGRKKKYRELRDRAAKYIFPGQKKPC